MASCQTPNIGEIKAEVDKLWKLLNELYERLVLQAPVIMEIEPEIKIENILIIVVREEGKEREKERK